MTMGIAIGLMLGFPAGVWARGRMRFDNPRLSGLRRLFLAAMGF
jgi:hypothetical protein